jgi:hypothetical protein
MVTPKIWLVDKRHIKTPARTEIGKKSSAKEEGYRKCEGSSLARKTKLLERKRTPG